MVNRDELARRIAYRGGYGITDIKQVLKLYEDVVEEALKNGEEVKQGKLYKIQLKKVPKKRAYNGFEKTYFVRPAKKVPKFKLLCRLENIEIPIESEE